MPDRKAPPDPGGYLVESNLGGPPTFHNYNGPDLHGPAAIDKFNRYASSPKPGGSIDKENRKDKKER